MSIIGIAVVTILQTMYRTNNFDVFNSLYSVGVKLLFIFLSVQLVFIINIIISVVNSHAVFSRQLNYFTLRNNELNFNNG